MCAGESAGRLASVLARLHRPVGHAAGSGAAVRRAKVLGQNFLFDRQVLARFAAAAGDLRGTELVVEIGAGPGGLTTSLLAAGARRVVAVERDAPCIEALRSSGLEEAAGAALRLIHGDARKISLSQICDEEAIHSPGSVRVVGNLPFSVGTRLLVNWVTPPDVRIESFTLLFQTEVAERICAAHNTSQYSRLSVLIQAWASARMLYTIPASAFVPPPKVGTTLVSIAPLQPHQELASQDRRLLPEESSALLAVTAAAFRQVRV